METVVSNRQDIERDTQVLALRSEGQSFRQIGEHLGITRQRATQLWERAAIGQRPPGTCWCGVEIPWVDGPGRRQKYCSLEHVPRAPASGQKRRQRRRTYQACTACKVAYDEPRTTTPCNDCQVKLKARRVHYSVMHEQQQGLCAICGEPETAPTKSGAARKLAIDHNHKTGAIRELLCGSCNRMIGQAKERIDILESAIEYLKRHAV